ncbi:META domain-containing protein [Luteococcus sp. Sow4_B9]|uniref:META domain-containing protein n=1 Tax=Luteococcus sp. Sow4_B9 TaxID=3438792 RepID=UPI003F97294D
MKNLRNISLTVAAIATLGGTALVAPTANATPQQAEAKQVKATSDSFSDREWRLRLPGVSPSVYDIGWITIHRNGSVSGSDGCNNFFGSASVDAASDTITFDGVGTTRRACRFTQPTGSAYVKASALMNELVDGTATFSVRGRTATVISDEGTSSTWVTSMPVARTSASAVTNRDWHLSVEGISPELANRAWIRIDSQGQLSGSNGCNRIFGKAAIDANKGTITFGALGSTMMACFHEDEQTSIDASTVEQLIGSLSETTATYIATGSRLIVTTEAGEKLEFVR